jgi:hypothetical protein
MVAALSRFPAVGEKNVAAFVLSGGFIDWAGGFAANRESQVVYVAF